MGAAFLTYSLMHWVKAWEAAVARTLFEPEARDTHFAEFLVDDLLRADFTKRADGIAKLVASLVMSPNEGRRIGFNLPPYEGGDAFRNPNVSTPEARAE